MGERQSGGLVDRRRRNRFFVPALLAALAAALAMPIGCGLDDTVLDQLSAIDGSASNDGTFNDAPTPTPIDAGDAGNDVEVCVANSCAAFTSQCGGDLDGGCGAVLNCTCAAPNACDYDSGFCSGPPSCLDAGAPGGNCNVITNPGNGQTTNCGTCGGNYDCTGAGSTCACSGTKCGAGGSTCCKASNGLPNCNATSGTCCKLKTCAVDYNGKCGPTNDDGCGGNLDCAPDAGVTNCGGGSVCDLATNNCCTVTTTCGTSCNTTLTTNCGTSLPCLACATGTCNGTTCCPNAVCGTTCCTAGQECNGTACCTPNLPAITCAGKCGTVMDNCNQPVDCGDCSITQVCTGAATCACDQGSLVGGSPATCNPGDTCCHGPTNYFCHNGGCL